MKKGESFFSFFLFGQLQTLASSPSFFSALKKKIDLIEQYKQLKSRGALEEFMSKRRKKMVLRDHRLFPRARNEGAPNDK